MKRKRPIGVTVFCIIYNILGLTGVSAYFYGFNALARASSLVIGEIDYTQTIGIVITVLFFLSSYLLISFNQGGYLIPIFLLTFFVFGGFVVLLPVLIAHFVYFTHPRVLKQFA